MVQQSCRPTVLGFSGVGGVGDYNVNCQHLLSHPAGVLAPPAQTRPSPFCGQTPAELEISDTILPRLLCKISRLAQFFGVSSLHTDTLKDNTAAVV